VYAALLKNCIQAHICFVAKRLLSASWILCSTLSISAVWLSLPHPAPGKAQTSGIVSGRVTDQTETAVAGAVITLKSQDQDRIAIVLSNGEGEYVFNGVPAAVYSFTVKSPTFDEYVVNNLTVSADDYAKADAVLSPGAENVAVTIDAAGAPVDTLSALSKPSSRLPLSKIYRLTETTSSLCLPCFLASPA